MLRPLTDHQIKEICDSVGDWLREVRSEPDRQMIRNDKLEHLMKWGMLTSDEAVRNTVEVS